MVTPAVRDDGKVGRAHAISGGEARRALRQGDGAHVFDPDVDLADLERKVWTEGRYLGRVGGRPAR